MTESAMQNSIRLLRELVELLPADWAENYFSAQSARIHVQPSNSVAFLHEVVFFIDRHS